MVCGKGADETITKLTSCATMSFGAKDLNAHHINYTFTHEMHFQNKTQSHSDIKISTGVEIKRQRLLRLQKQKQAAQPPFWFPFPQSIRRPVVSKSLFPFLFPIARKKI